VYLGFILNLETSFKYAVFLGVISSPD
jgi:hypothetical protein